MKELTGSCFLIRSGFLTLHLCSKVKTKMFFEWIVFGFRRTCFFLAKDIVSFTISYELKSFRAILLVYNFFFYIIYADIFQLPPLVSAYNAHRIVRTFWNRLWHAVHKNGRDKQLHINCYTSVCARNHKREGLEQLCSPRPHYGRSPSINSPGLNSMIAKNKKNYNRPRLPWTPFGTQTPFGKTSFFIYPMCFLQECNCKKTKIKY